MNAGWQEYVPVRRLGPGRGMGAHIGKQTGARVVFHRRASERLADVRSVVILIDPAGSRFALRPDDSPKAIKLGRGGDGLYLNGGSALAAALGLALPCDFAMADEEELLVFTAVQQGNA